MQRHFPGESSTSHLLDRPSYQPTFNANQSKPTKRRTSQSEPTNVKHSKEGEAYDSLLQRRRFREQHRMTEPLNADSVGTPSKGVKRRSHKLNLPQAQMEGGSRSRRPRLSHRSSTEASTYAAGPSASDNSLHARSDASEDSSTSVEESLRREPEDGPSASQNLSFLLAPSTASATANSGAATSSVSRQIHASRKDAGRSPRPCPPMDSGRGSVPNLNGLASSKDTSQPKRSQITFNAAIESVLLVGMGVWACWQLWHCKESAVREKAGGEYTSALLMHR